METGNETKKGGWFSIPPVVRHLLKVVIGAAALWALIGSGTLDPHLVGRAFLNHPWVCTAAFGVYVGMVVLSAWLRWYLLLVQAGLKVSPWRCLKLHMIGIFFNSLIPGGTGGDLVKGYYLFKE